MGNKKEWTSIRIKAETHAALMAERNPGESLQSVIMRKMVERGVITDAEATDLLQPPAKAKEYGLMDMSLGEKKELLVDRGGLEISKVNTMEKLHTHIRYLNRKYGRKFQSTLFVKDKCLWVEVTRTL